MKDSETSPHDIPCYAVSGSINCKGDAETKERLQMRALSGLTHREALQSNGNLVYKYIGQGQGWWAAPLRASRQARHTRERLSQACRVRPAAVNARMAISSIGICGSGGWKVRILYAQSES